MWEVYSRQRRRMMTLMMLFCFSNCGLFKWERDGMLKVKFPLKIQKMKYEVYWDRKQSWQCQHLISGENGTKDRWRASPASRRGAHQVPQQHEVIAPSALTLTNVLRFLSVLCFMILLCFYEFHSIFQVRCLSWRFKHLWLMIKLITFVAFCCVMFHFSFQFALKWKWSESWGGILNINPIT